MKLSTLFLPFAGFGCRHSLPASGIAVISFKKTIQPLLIGSTASGCHGEDHPVRLQLLAYEDAMRGRMINAAESFAAGWYHQNRKPEIARRKKQLIAS